MVGGRVVATIETADRIYVDCQEVLRHRGRPQTCAIYVVRNADSEQIRPGDNVWWQGKWAMWTPADRRFTDRQIPRASYSGVKPPKFANQGKE